jgi:predicted metal-dependent phosphotriesterase family hydrolase
MTSPSSLVRTVSGDIPSSELGVTNAHAHLFLGSPLLAGQELDDLAAATAEARAFAAAGGNAIVQWTPAGLGRRRGELPGIAAEAGIHILSATGRHRAAHYPDGHREDAEELAGRLVADLTAGPGQCGLIKIGTGYHHLDSFERASLRAAAYAQHETGAPVGIHLERGTGGELVLGVLRGHGVPVTSIILGHVGRNPDDGYLLDLAGSGAFLCFDGPSQANHPTDWRTPACIATLAEHGHLGQLLAGGDTTTAAARSVTAGPGMPGLLASFGRRIAAVIGAAGWNAMTVSNPARAFSLRER